MATCTNICTPKKYTEDELRRFQDRVENVLQNQECRSEFCEFLKETKKIDFVIYVNIWDITNDIIENRPDSPKFVSKRDELTDMLKVMPKLIEFIDNLDDVDNLKELRKKVCRELRNSHRLFVRYLLKKCK